MADPTSKTIIDVVSTRLKDAGIEVVTEKAVTALVDREVQKRADSVVKVIDILDKERRELRKVDRADVIAYDKDRKPVREEYSKQRLDEIDKVKKRINKLEAALEKALVKDDFGDLFNAASGQLKDEPAAATGDGGSES